ncbi:hypothetical protein M7I_1336 [Glarea lozoyensis 74030]|uniref:Uncharacterized protein n=1 Tax=Glarea lozoyensis (strain ATCC 74030 / MF5533) TaxID=1104152 RepID=H0EFS9_GLAL7|nr:hypothetical protein M7I_1336 [Glarea lozoyensis 74030]
MRVKQITRPRTPLVTILPRFGTLELVAEKNDDEIDVKAKSQKSKKIIASEAQINPEVDEDMVLLDELAPEEEASLINDLEQCVDIVEFEDGGPRNTGELHYCEFVILCPLLPDILLTLLSFGESV